MPDAFIYRADICCAPCGEAIRAGLTLSGRAPEDPTDESSYDSDDFPKGPFADGGGEADAPQHCACCGVFLENPLTRAGVAYVRELLSEGSGNLAVLETWRDFYRDEMEQESE